MVIALGTNINDQFDISKLRYHRIVIMTDADVDGSHIRTLLLTLFFRHFKELVTAGHLYVAQPPLYQIKKGKNIKYVFSDEEKDSVIKEFGGMNESEEKPSSNIKIQRYKGLGEMNPDQLWDTTMDPEKRFMFQITVEDASRADETFEMLMGGDVAPRKKFIQTNAQNVKNLDV